MEPYPLTLGTHNLCQASHSGVYVRGSVWFEKESDYYGNILIVYELHYREDTIILFKCHCFDTTRGVRVVHRHDLVEVKYGNTLTSSDVFILPSRAQ